MDETERDEYEDYRRKRSRIDEKGRDSYPLPASDGAAYSTTTPIPTPVIHRRHQSSAPPTPISPVRPRKRVKPVKTQKQLSARRRSLKRRQSNTKSRGSPSTSTSSEISLASLSIDDESKAAYAVTPTEYALDTTGYGAFDVVLPFEAMKLD